MNPLLLNLIGLAGGGLFAACGCPAAYHTWKAGKSIGIPISTALMISGGGIFMYLFLLFSYGFNWILAINYFVEVGSWSVVVYYHFKK